MKSLAMLLVSFLAAQASASEISCQITRTNRYDSSDVSTHQFVHRFDAANRQGRNITSGYVESFLLPKSVDVSFFLEVVDYRALETRLELFTVGRRSGNVITSGQSFGSITTPPASVENKFQTESVSYSVVCDVLN